MDLSINKNKHSTNSKYMYIIIHFCSFFAGFSVLDTFVVMNTLKEDYPLNRVQLC